MDWWFVYGIVMLCLSCAVESAARTDFKCPTNPDMEGRIDDRPYGVQRYRVLFNVSSVAGTGAFPAGYWKRLLRLSPQYRGTIFARLSVNNSGVNSYWYS